MRNILITSTIIVTFVCHNPLAEAADKAIGILCVKTSTGALALRQKRCSRGETRLRTRGELTGEDGSVMVYGDGSDGDLTVSDDTTLTDTLRSYRNCTINSGKTLTVLPGTTIRCTGTFTNNGTVSVLQFPNFGQVYQVSPLLNSLNNFQPGAGFSPGPAGNGNIGSNVGQIWGGKGGSPLDASIGEGGTDPRLLIRGSWISAGGGGGSTGSSGGGGGGVVRILSKGALTIAAGATVSANGGDSYTEGGGGGGGGYVLLASSTSVSAAGAVEAKGGAGSAASASTAHGGGGGGGAVFAIAPTISTTGTTDVSHGASGGLAAAGTVSNSTRFSGGGGGGSCGQGQTGGFAATDGSTFDGGNSPSDGCVYTKLADPVAYFF